MNNEKIKVRFEVVKLLHRNSDDGYSIFKAKFTHYPAAGTPTTNIVIVGNFNSIRDEDEFEGEGSWTVHEVYGYQFKMEWNELYNPVTKKSIKQFLKRFVKGISSKTADSIVDYYQEETLPKIRESWENLTVIDGVSEKRAKMIHEKVVEHDKFEKISMFILQYGLGYKVCHRIYEGFGDKAIERIKENPYSLCDIPKINFQTADRFAKVLNFPSNNPLRLKSGVLFVLELKMKHCGHLYLERGMLVSKALEYLTNKGEYKNDSEINEKDIEKAIDELLIERKLISEKNVQNDQCIYISFYNKVENDIVRKLTSLTNNEIMGTVSMAKVEDFIIDFEGNNSIKFSENQKKAIQMTMRESVSILTGGPGTGKTQTINSIIRCIEHFNPMATILLAAPTGKAAKRMTELTKMESKTIHRLIKISGSIDEDNETELLYADYLIVDESSMIDAYVFYKLISSIDKNTRLLLVGDIDQLPSVGPGLILRDLINSGSIPTTRLNEIFRQAKESQIIMNSHKLINGRKTTGDNALIFDSNKKDFYFVQRSEKLKIQEGILESIDKFINNHGRKLSEIQVLTPMKDREIGVKDLNRLIQKQFNPPYFSKPEIKVDETNVFRIGDKVMQVINNYDLNVFNGEVGYITNIERDGAEYMIMVDYGDKEITYDYLTVDELTLAYAITIHKAQGSEFPIVIMPIHESHSILLNRNIIYTAWTRAKEIVMCIGLHSTLDEAVDRIDNTVRNSKIKEKLEGSIKLRTAV